MIKMTGAFAMALMAFAMPGAAHAQTTDGFRVEAHVGYDHQPGNSTPQIQRRGGDGVLFGGGVGYDLDLGGVVIGPEINLDFTTAKTSFSFPQTGYRGEATGGRDIDLSLRAGFRAGAATLLYVKGGYDNARFKSVTSLGTSSDNNEGWRVGTGVEQRLGGRTYAKFEYRYTNYGRLASFDDNSARHQLVAGLGVRF